MSRVPYRSFLTYNATGAVVWAGETAVVGYLAGAGYRAAASRLSVIGLGLLALIVGAYALHLLRRHPRPSAWLAARTDPCRWTGRPLTVTLAAAAAAGWLFAGMTQDVLGHDGAAVYDLRWHDWVVHHRSAVLDDLAHVLTYLGYSPFAYLLLAAAIVVVVRRTRRWREAALAASALVVGQLIRAGICQLIHRARPPRADWLMAADGYSYPSGHTTTATLAWGLVVALCWPLLATRGRRVAAVAAAVVIALLVGASRVWLGVHWPTDVLGGWALGAALLTLSASAVAALRPRPASSTVQVA